MIGLFAPLYGADPIGGAPTLPDIIAGSTLAIVGGRRDAALTSVDVLDVPEQAFGGASIRTIGGDIFERLHLSESVLDLGNVAGLQARVVTVWNAFRQVQTLAALTLDDGDGITVTGPSNPPTTFGPMGEIAYTVAVAAEGPPTIAARVTWDFAPYDLVLTISGTRITAWTFSPDWSAGILERLAWQSDVMRSFDLTEQRSALRLGPRQSWEFEAFLDDQRARRYAESVLWSNGARVWALPIWPDGIDILEDLPAGSTEILTDTGGRAFVDGGLALVLAGPTSFETVEIESVETGRLVLARGTSSPWMASARVYPARVARLADAARLERWDGRLSGMRAVFDVVGAIDGAADAGAASHRGAAVLERRPEWSGGFDLELARKLAQLDNITGRAFVEDEAGRPDIAQRMRWVNVNRSEAQAFRGLLYHLAGRVGAIWVPTWTDDLVVKVTIASSSSAIDVEWVGYTENALLAVGRSDLRIELVDGTVFYRQILGATVVDAQTERIQIDAVLGRQVEPDEVLQVSFMALCRLDADAVEIAHWTGEASESATVFRGVTP